MKRSRTYALAGILAAGSLALTACSDNVESSGAAGAGGSSNIECGTGSLNASGSSAQAKAVDAWQAAFSAVCPDMTINYDASGSGAGINDFIAAKTQMAGSDSALKEEETAQAAERCEGGTPINIPMVISPVAVVYNVSGLDSLSLSPEVLAGIFSGTITTWNDPAIGALNEGVDLPSTTISTVHRSKDSGTTENFTSYLEAASGGAWTHGTGKAWNAPGGQGAPDSAGVAAAVSSTDGSISYVDAPDAEANDLQTVALDSGFGGVEITEDSVGVAVEAAQRAGEGNDIRLELDYGLKEEGAYPLVLVAYEITCETGLGEEDATNVKAFLTYASGQGQNDMADVGYTPLPDSLKADVEAAVESISA